MSEADAALRVFSTTVRQRATKFIEAQKRGDIYDETLSQLIDRADNFRQSNNLFDYVIADAEVLDRACAIIVSRLFKEMETD